MAKKTKTDPTGQRNNRAKTTKRLSIRLDRSERKVRALFRSIPRKRRQVIKTINEVQVFYDYDLTPEQRQDFNDEIRKVLDDELLETQNNTVPIAWWYRPEVELPTRQGTLEELVQFNALIALAVSLGITGTGGITPQRIAPESVLSSNRYLTELRNVYVENFQVIKSLSDRTASQTIQVINSGMSAGATPTSIAKDISKRFDVSKSSAKRIAETEVNKAYTNAKMKATKTAEELTGLRARVRHISALLPKRTRPTHAARHGKIFTVEEQTAWWDSGSNRINCKCTVNSVLIDGKGNVIER